MNSSAPAKRAEHFFENGHNCSQSVLMAFAPRFGLDEEPACRLASGFGVGLSTGETCGAVSGAVMVLGLAFGGGGPGGIEAKRRTYRLTREFMTRFQACHGTVRCRDLLGCDPSTPEGGARAGEKFLFDTICAPLVTDVVAILEKMISEQAGC
ncbi:MAG: C-GCAxxG-C-C family protein [Desulfovibrionales bacterium]